eukprot:g1649.t1
MIWSPNDHVRVELPDAPPAITRRVGQALRFTVVDAATGELAASFTDRLEILVTNELRALPDQLGPGRRELGVAQGDTFAVAHPTDPINPRHSRWFPVSKCVPRLTRHQEFFALRLGAAAAAGASKRCSAGAGASRDEDRGEDGDGGEDEDCSAGAGASRDEDRGEDGDGGEDEDGDIDVEGDGDGNGGGGANEDGDGGTRTVGGTSRDGARRGRATTGADGRNHALVVTILSLGDESDGDESMVPFKDAHASVSAAARRALDLLREKYCSTPLLFSDATPGAVPRAVSRAVVAFGGVVGAPGAADDKASGAAGDKASNAARALARVMEAARARGAVQAPFNPFALRRQELRQQQQQHKQQEQRQEQEQEQQQQQLQQQQQQQQQQPTQPTQPQPMQPQQQKEEATMTYGDDDDDDLFHDRIPYPDEPEGRRLHAERLD